MTTQITAEFAGKTVKDWFFSNGFSNNQIKRLKSLDDGILLNGQRVTVRRLLSPGDTLSLRLEDDDGNPALVPTEMPLPILYEDENIIALDKPAGMPTHPSHGHFEDTLANGLAFLFGKRGEPFVFRAVNRLDRGTSGIVLVAKNSKAAADLSGLMKAGRIKKTYVALVNGAMSGSGVIDRPIRRQTESIITREVCDIDSPGAKRAVSEYRVISFGGGWSFVELNPVTGRTHQLRVHLSSVGHPIAGDGLYGTAETVPTALDRLFDRPALHCRRLRIFFADSDILIEAPLPDDIRAVVGETES